MKIHRVKAMVVRHWFNYIHGWDKLVDSFYWPSMDILLWGLTSAWIRSEADIPNLVVIMLTGLVFWQIVWRNQYEFTINILEEMWHQNLVSLFASPLKISEWIASSITLGFVKMLFTSLFCLGLTWILYAVRLWDGGWGLIPAIALLLMNGWWIGLLIAGLLVRFGTRIQTIAWSGTYLLAPFSAIYYPVSALPYWGQQIAWWIPMSHIFTYMRSLVMKQPTSFGDLLIPFVMTVAYVTLAAWWFVASMNASRKIGLARLE